MTNPHHLAVLQQLLPPVSYDPNGEHIKVELSATAKVLDDLQDSAILLLSAVNPAQVPELLPEWEAAYGLPDACDGSIAVTTEERLGALFAKMSANKPLQIPLLESIAEQLGFAGTTVTKHLPIDFIMDVNSPYERGIQFANCVSPCNVPLAIFEEPLLECVFRKLEPAHALFKFYYGV